MTLRSVSHRDAAAEEYLHERELVKEGCQCHWCSPRRTRNRRRRDSIRHKYKVSEGVFRYVVNTRLTFLDDNHNPPKENTMASIALEDTGTARSFIERLRSEVMDRCSHVEGAVTYDEEGIPSLDLVAFIETLGGGPCDDTEYSQVHVQVTLLGEEEES